MRPALKGGQWLLFPVLAPFLRSICGLCGPDGAAEFPGNWPVLLVLVVGIMGAFVPEYENANIGAKELLLIAC